MVQLSRSLEEFQQGVRGAEAQGKVFERMAAAFDFIEKSAGRVRAIFEPFWLGIAKYVAGPLKEMMERLERIENQRVEAREKWGAAEALSKRRADAIYRKFDSVQALLEKLSEETGGRYFNPDNLAVLCDRVGEFHRLDIRLAHVHRLDDSVFDRLLDSVKADHPASRTLAVRAVGRRGRVHAHDRLAGLREQVKNLVVFRGNGVVRLVVENGNPAKVIQDHAEILRALGARRVKLVNVAQRHGGASDARASGPRLENM
jgi:hypothetical protein